VIEYGQIILKDKTIHIYIEDRIPTKINLNFILQKLQINRIKMTDKWIENINKINQQQDNMIELNIHNGKIIYIEDNDCELCNDDYINNKQNIMKWRHIYSFLPSDTIELINQLIYKDIYKNYVLNIHRPIYTSKLYENKNENILMNEKLRECNRSNNLSTREEYDIRDEESYEMIDIEKETNIMEDKIRRNKNWININVCNMKMKNGKKCRCDYSKNIDIKKYGIFVKSLCNYQEDFTYNYEEKQYEKDGLGHYCSIRLCGKHLNRRKKNYNEWDTIKKFYNDNGYDINKWGYCIKCK